MMNHKRFISCVSMFLILALSGFVDWQKPVSAQASQGSDAPLAEPRVEAGKIRWEPLVAADGWLLSVAGPDGWVQSFIFEGSAAPELALEAPGGARLADGAYRYELRPVNKTGSASQPQSQAGDTAGDGRSAGSASAQSPLPGTVSVQEGSFTIQNGVFLLPSGAVEPAGSAEPAGSTEPGALTGIEGAPQDAVVNPGDFAVTGSLCVGFDCIAEEVFGFDTIRLKENNTRIAFDDTSAVGFPANDWAIVANDSASGGASFLAFQDVTGAKFPFFVMAGAPTNSLNVASSGNVGLGTGIPAKDLHIFNSDTPAVRFEQDGSGGFMPQTWDVAGNEANFFVRDVTGGSRLPFRIRPGAPTSSLDIAASGNVGIGTASALYALDVVKTSADPSLAVRRTDGATALVSAQADKVQLGTATNHNLELVVNNSPVLTLDAQGNATLSGVLYEHSDVNVKEAFQPVDRSQVLDQLASLPITTWSYQSDAPGVRHMGPMAQDFHAAFGLGAQDTHIAALDVNGVTLAATQELLALVETQADQVNQLEAENQALKDRLDTLERLVNQALGAQPGAVLPAQNPARTNFSPCRAR